jgi:hypothetical protein
MVGIIFGFMFMIIGGLLILSGIKRNKKINVTASNGSMAVGGDNSGVMINTATNNASSLPDYKAHGHGITILGIVVELIAIGVTVWHALHLAAK